MSWSGPKTATLAYSNTPTGNVERREMDRRLVIGVVAAVVVAGGALVLVSQRPGIGPGTTAGRIASTAPAPERQALVDGHPAFDVVRVEADGRTVIAGRALPGDKVTVSDAGGALGTVTADARGDWVLIPDQPLQPGGRELRVEAVGADGTARTGDQTVVLVVPERDRDIAGRPKEGSRGVLALVAPRTSGTPRLLASPQGPRGEGAPQAGFEAVDYDRAGRIALSGWAAPGAEVQIYLDGTLIGHAAADAGGHWGLRPERAVEPGSYTLRVDQVGPGGKVTARAEVSFPRRPIAEDSLGDRAVVVVPGNNLWTIARRSYGEGPRFTAIFEANQDQIKDPDLIYPGQIFVMPAPPPAPAPAAAGKAG
jgi:hypothetical protein